jgi:hypothetical protein
MESSEPPEVVLENIHPVWMRLCVMGGGVYSTVWATCEFVANPDSSAGKLLFFIFVGGLCVRWAVFTSDLRWTIRGREIRIDRIWLYDREDIEFIRSGEITRIRIDRVDDESVYFHIRLSRSSGEDLKSPPIVDAQRARELRAEIARRLNAPLEEGASS